MTQRVRATRAPKEVRLDGWLLAISAALAAVFTSRLGAQAARGIFGGDECFHAYAAEWILAHRRLPVVLPELYSGFYYYYPPLLHLLGALGLAVAGVASLHVLPALFTGGTLAVLLLGARGAVPAPARAAAVLLCLLNASIADYAVRFYVESLTTLLFALAGVLALQYRRTETWRLAIGLGLVTGAALLTKLFGWLLVGGIAALAVWDGLRGNRRSAARLTLALTIAVVMALPWLIRNQVLFGSALYPGFAPDLDPALYALNQRRFSTPLPAFLRGIPAAMGPALTLCAAAAILAVALRRDRSPRAGLLAFSLAGMVAVALTPMASSRHLNSLVVLVALASAAIVLEALGTRHGLRWAAMGALVAAAAFRVVALPDVRTPADPPPYLREAFRQIEPLIPRDARVLSLWTYDTFYYTRRAATWPNPWGQGDRPVEMFTERDPDRFLAELDRHRIGYVLVPTRAHPAEFDSANYPETFLRQINDLVRRGALEAVWTSDRLALVRNPGARPAQESRSR